MTVQLKKKGTNEVEEIAGARITSISGTSVTIEKDSSIYPAHGEIRFRHGVKRVVDTRDTEITEY